MRLLPNYNRPGVGISKNAPEKREFFKFFQYFFGNFWKLFVSNVWILLLSVPLLTIGLGQVGAAYVCRTVARDKQYFGTSDFFSAIKRNWKRSLGLGIINLLINVIFYFNIITILAGMAGTQQYIMLGATAFVYVIVSFARFYQYTLAITFDFTVFQIIKNSLLLATAGLKKNFLIGICLVLNYGFVFLCFLYFGSIGAALGTLYLLLIFPIFRMYLIQFNVFPVIKKQIIDPYYENNPDADKDKRRALGILEDDEEDKSVFSDEELL